ncbi:putative DNA-binding domain-containing protein [Cysteiniphilum sp. QT6929]|uniref:HvfC/BufC family peptide modification chaperone n=1 Tax=Cysteiniphilum sp. QT6929 TaxID=2975055 RepID=UPI0024B33AE1|nr:putative DNA-binding domain-containing protein [Cysteiniphilum sp. QT6929]WHN66234.1 putative DNA-binding domain-containing protein [Cysteiniphilum sp. QT6929]
MPNYIQHPLKPAPSNFVMAIDKLCAKIRDKQNNITSSSHTLYRSFILGNINSVIAVSFPLFHKIICCEQLSLLVDDFLMHHHATEPQFHHIATEFLRFAQLHRDLPKILLSLLEYEWLLFSTESNPLILHNQSQITVTKKNSKISINPTLQYICMPFELKDYHDYCPIDSGQFIYGVFRNLNGHVITKHLSHDEANLLKTIDAINNPSFTDILKTNNGAINLNALTSLIKIDLVHIKHEE